MASRVTTIVAVLGLLMASAAYGEELGQGLLKGVGQALDAGTGKNVTQNITQTDEDEIATGRQIAGNILGASPLVKDDHLQRYVNLVGRWVADQSERPGLAWHFGVIQSDDVNAFAVPGGYVFVTRGLYRMLTNEAQLAGVLAHEISHVVKKDHYKLIQQARAVEAGSKFLSSKVAEDDQMAKRLIGGGAEVFARSLDKGAEYGSDRMAVVLSARAGYDPYAYVEVLQMIGEYAKEDDSVKLLFKTHPSPDDRLKKLDKAMGTKFDKLGGVTLADRFYVLKG